VFELVSITLFNILQDITPPAISTWLRQPVERVHVLLDRKGKTLSHAFVEMASPEAAKIALRTSQNSVLGKGKRARGVTVTRSNQEELMRSVCTLNIDPRCFVDATPSYFPHGKGPSTA
jgi:hypothetical protein